MSVVGIDFGNLSLLIAQAAKGGVDVILNDASNRQTATCVSIQGKQRFLGDAAAAMARSNITNTISCMKLLVGRKFDSPDVQRELSKAPFKTVKSENGGIGIQVSYNDETIVVSPEQVMGMMLVKAKDIAAKANNNISVAESVLAVPFWFTDAQRRGILRACEIAGLNCLKITNESNAIALSYGIFKSAKSLFSLTEPTHVMFVDIGYSGTCFTIVDFIQENMRVLATVCDRELGGRDLDDAIIEFLIESFQKKTGINVRGNWKAQLKLQVAAEKAKKTLSPSGVNEANVSVECLSEDKDLSIILTREEFEGRVKSLVNRLEAPAHRCLALAGLTSNQLADVEVVGGSTRVNIIKRRLGEILGLDPSAMSYGLKTTMNSDEAVARGAALQCALMSSRIKVKTFNIIDRLPYGIVAHYEVVPPSANTDNPTGTQSTDESETNEAIQVKGTSAQIYTANEEISQKTHSTVGLKTKRMTFKRKNADFDIVLRYDEESVATLPPGEDTLIGKFTIKVPPIPVGAPVPDVRVTFNIDKHGCAIVQSAQQMVEEAVTPTPPTPSISTDEEKKEDAPPVEIKKKIHYRKVELEVVSDVFTLSKDFMKNALELEANMANEDRLITETADKRNELESYLYSIRDKLDGVLKSFVTAEEADKIRAAVTSAEDWLYNDGFDSTKQEYSRKLEEVRSLGGPAERRLADAEGRSAAVDSLRKQIDLCKTFASNYDEAHSHIDEDERTKLRNAVTTVENWLFDSLDHQAALEQHADPVLTVAAVNKKRSELFAISNPIMTKPRPAPTIPTPASNAESSESKDHKEDKADSKEGMDVDQDPKNGDAGHAGAGESKQEAEEMDM